MDYLFYVLLKEIVIFNICSEMKSNIVFYSSGFVLNKSSNFYQEVANHKNYQVVVLYSMLARTLQSIDLKKKKKSKRKQYTAISSTE